MPYPFFKFARKSTSIIAEMLNYIFGGKNYEEISKSIINGDFSSTSTWVDHLLRYKRL